MMKFPVVNLYSQLHMLAVAFQLLTWYTIPLCSKCLKGSKKVIFLSWNGIEQA